MVSSHERQRTAESGKAIAANARLFDEPYQLAAPVPLPPAIRTTHPSLYAEAMLYATRRGLRCSPSSGVPCVTLTSPPPGDLAGRRRRLVHRGSSVPVSAPRHRIHPASRTGAPGGSVDPGEFGHPTARRAALARSVGSGRRRSIVECVIGRKQGYPVPPSRSSIATSCARAPGTCDRSTDAGPGATTRRSHASCT